MRGAQARPVVRRPGAVRAAAAVLLLMAVGGLAYGVAVLASLNGLVERFRSGAARAPVTADEADSVIGLLRFGAVINTVVTVTATVLLIVLALGLLHGGRTTRVVTWVVCGLGLVCGWSAVGALVAQHSLPLRFNGSQQSTSSLLRALAEAYPSWWSGVAGGLSAAQALGYLLVAVLLALPSAGAFYRRMAIEPGPPPLAGSAPSATASAYPTGSAPSRPVVEPVSAQPADPSSDSDAADVRECRDRDP